MQPAAARQNPIYRYRPPDLHLLFTLLPERSEKYGGVYKALAAKDKQPVLYSVLYSAHSDPAQISQCLLKRKRMKSTPVRTPATTTHDVPTGDLPLCDEMLDNLHTYARNRSR